MSSERAASPEPPDAGGPVTTTVTRRVKPGHETAYEEVLEGIVAAASGFPGHLGGRGLSLGPSRRRVPHGLQVRVRRAPPRRARLRGALRVARARRAARRRTDRQRVDQPGAISSYNSRYQSPSKPYVTPVWTAITPTTSRTLQVVEYASRTNWRVPGGRRPWHPRRGRRGASGATRAGTSCARRAAPSPRGRGPAGPPWRRAAGRRPRRIPSAGT